MRLERRHLKSVMTKLNDLAQDHEKAKEKNDAMEYPVTGWGDYCKGYAEGMRASIGFIETLLMHTEDE